jgi:hypothetical protein
MPIFLKIIEFLEAESSLCSNDETRDFERAIEMTTSRLRGDRSPKEAS